MAHTDNSAWSGISRRADRRYAVLWSGQIDNPTGTIDCAILNVSASGAKLRLHSQTACPPRVTVDCARLGRLSGRVVWHRNDELGLSFLESPDDVVDSLIRGLPGRVHRVQSQADEATS